MSIIVNDKTVDYVDHETVTDLLKRMHYTFPLIIIKIDGKLVKKQDYSTTFIPDNADIKAIHLISGG